MAKAMQIDEYQQETHYMKDTVTLVFKENRKYELHIWNDVYTFWGQEPVEVPRSVLTHKDFHDEIKNLFIIKG